jgi:hypothetical protein
MVALAIVSCSGDGKPAAAGSTALPDVRDPHALVAALDTMALGGADASSTWKAWLQGGAVVRIDERMTMSDSSTSTLVHYFTSAGKLVATTQSRAQIVQNTDRSPSTSSVLLTLEFTGDSATRVEKTVDGAPREVQRFEIDGARNHAMALLDVARTAPSAPKRP